MSPEVITNRLKMMEQLWELSVNLIQAQEISEATLLNDKSLEKDWNSKKETAWSRLADVSPVK